MALDLLGIRIGMSFVVQIKALFNKIKLVKECISIESIVHIAIYSYYFISHLSVVSYTNTMSTSNTNDISFELIHTKYIF